MKKKTVAKLKVTRKLEGILPAFFMLVCIPRHHNKKKLPSRQLLLHIPRPVSIGLYQRFFKYIDDFSTYISGFFIISTVRHRISIYRHFSTIKTLNIPYPPSNLLPNSTIKKIINRIASIFNATYATLKTT